MKKVFVCSDTVTGIFSGIYDAWKLNLEGEQVGVSLKHALLQELFCEYLEVEESERKAAAVENLIKKHLGDEAYWHLYHAILAEDEDKGDAVLGMMIEAKRIPDSRKIMDHLSHPKVQRVFELSRKVSNEAHSYKEFVRFRELNSGVLFAKINPKNQVLTCIAEHFSNRLPLENWLIYDETHHMVLLHRERTQWVLVVGEEIDLTKTKCLSEEERRVEKLWKGFTESISIKERENPKLQRQHLPIRYRENMIEFAQ